MFANQGGVEQRLEALCSLSTDRYLCGGNNATQVRTTKSPEKVRRPDSLTVVPSSSNDTR